MRSVYELLTPPHVLRKTHFWDWFSGTTLKNAWATDDISGSGHTYRMVDDIDQGFEIFGTEGSNQGRITFSTPVEHYDPDNSVCIAVWKAVGDAGNRQLLVGFSDATDTAASFAVWKDRESQTTKQIRSRDNAAGSATDVAAVSLTDTVFHNYKLDLDGVTMRGSLDGVLEVLKTDKYPTDLMAPSVHQVNLGSSGPLRIKYYEAYSK